MRCGRAEGSQGGWFRLTEPNGEHGLGGHDQALLEDWRPLPLALPGATCPLRCVPAAFRCPPHQPAECALNNNNNKNNKNNNNHNEKQKRNKN